MVVGRQESAALASAPNTNPPWKRTPADEALELVQYVVSHHRPEWAREDLVEPGYMLYRAVVKGHDLLVRAQLDGHGRVLTARRPTPLDLSLLRSGDGEQMLAAVKGAGWRVEPSHGSIAQPDVGGRGGVLRLDAFGYDEGPVLRDTYEHLAPPTGSAKAAERSGAARRRCRVGSISTIHDG